MIEILPTSGFRKAFKRKVRGNKILEKRFQDRVEIFQQDPSDQLVTKPSEMLTNRVAEVLSKGEELMAKVEALDLRRSAILRTDEKRIPSEKRNLEHNAELQDTETLEKRVRVIAQFVSSSSLSFR